ncbi:hypothetical protein A6A04_00210 [Paramagnetospirillum marisnigri]|uniref:Glutamine amidotransferase domain-containing protein n=1 Tax=Paramagnetospirillum marisnigri TaxID=1285242 RepID=A0A178MRP4_9PROT|nr:hypothetical protein [Paramagnetospirillum marisnigri]OAN52169.1 hypothetical protein A6A04_00210 [Paramagnetospirillum marisnigri]
MNEAFEAIRFAPLLPWPLLAGLAVPVLVVALAAARGRSLAGALRLVVGLVLLAALAGPRLVEEQRRPLADIAVVVVDDSLSQSILDRAARTEAALVELRARLERLPGLELRVERVGPTPGVDEGTRLFAAVERALADTPRRRLAGVVMITDGRVHDVPADLGRSLGVPVHALLSGSPGERDRRLVPGKVPAFGLVGKSAVFGFRVEDNGGGGGEAMVTLRLDGEPHAVISVPLNRDATMEVPLRHAGANVVELEAEAGQGELSLVNNRAAVSISGVRDRLKVLLISGEPHAGERTWRNLLKADPAVDLVHFTILRPPEKDDRTPIRELSLITFPVRELFEDKLADFDLVIFDRYRRRGVLASAYYRNLADYVRKGGALLMAVGPEFAEPGGLAESELARVLPALPTGRQLGVAFRPRLTEAGRRHPVTAGLPGSGAGTGEPSWGGWMRQIEVGEPRGATLLTGAAGLPLMVLDRVEEGRVAMILSDTAWLWARGWEGGGPHGEMLRRLGHWLMKEPELEEHALKAEIMGGQLTVTRRSPQPGAAEVTVTAPDGKAQLLALADLGNGSAMGRLAVSQPGLWRAAEEGGLVALAAAGSPSPVELAELTASDARLGPVAAATGGGLAWLSSGGVPEFRRVASGAVASGRGWMGLAERGDHVVDGLRETPLLPAWALLVLGLGGLLAAWWAEGRR